MIPTMIYDPDEMFQTLALFCCHTLATFGKIENVQME